MSRSLHPTSLLVGLLIGGACWLTMSQVAIPRSPAWGPAKQDIVNFWDPGPTSIPPGGSSIVFEVPSDKWLVLTAVDVTTSYPLNWAEDLNGVITVKSSNLGLRPQTTSPPIGWTFRPGSRVVLQNLESTNPSIVYNRTLFGYLSRD
jgi:hypothetical protein